MDKDKIAVLKSLSIRVDALRRAMDAVMSGTTEDHGKWGAFNSFARTYSYFAENYTRASGDASINMYNVERMGNSFSTPWPVQKELFDQIYADVLILSGLLAAYDTGVSASISEVQDLLVANLRKAIFGEPKNEIEVQNAIEVLLVGRGYQKAIDYDRETGRVKFSGKEFIPDFIFPNFDLALEVKLLKDKSQISKCVEEMSADVPAYLSKYRNLLFCVYDLGAIRDVSELQEGLQKHDGVRLCVIKH